MMKPHDYGNKYKDCERCGYTGHYGCTNTPCRFNVTHANWPQSVVPTTGPCNQPDVCGEFANQCQACVDEARQMADRVVQQENTWKFKALKCTKCGTKVVNDPKFVQGTINNCRHRAAHDPAGCGLYQVSEMVERLKAKGNGDPKPLVLPSQNTGNVVKLHPSKPAADADDLEFTFEVADPIEIFIHRNGNVQRILG